MKDLYEYRNPHNGQHSPMVSKEFLDIVTENADVSGYLLFSFQLSLCLCHSVCLSVSLYLQRLNSAIIYDRDFGYNYFGFKV